MSFYVIAAVAALGGLLFGYDTGVISGALLFIRKVMDLSPTAEGIVVAIALAGAALGAATAGQLSDRAGRRIVILGAAGLFVVGAVISGVAQVVVTLLIGRFIVGLGIGVASMLTPLYLAEISRARDRGAIVSLNQLCITAGILVSYLVDFSLAGTPGGMALDAGTGCTARRHPHGGDVGPSGKPALARGTRPDQRHQDGAATPARPYRRLGRTR